MVFITLSFSLSGNPYHIYFGMPALIYLLIKYFESATFNKLKAVTIICSLVMGAMFFYEKDKSNLYNPYIGQSLNLIQNSCFLPKSENNPAPQIIEGDCKYVDVPHWNYEIGTKFRILKTEKPSNHWTSNFLFYSVSVTEFMIDDGKKEKLVTDEISLFSFKEKSLFEPKLKSNLLSSALPEIINKLKWIAVLFAIYFLFSTNREGIKNNVGSFSVYKIDLVCIVISGYFVIFTAMNDGFSGPYLGIPYFLYLILLIFISNHLLIRLCCLMLIALAFVILVSDLSRNSLIYPIVGTSHTMEQDTEISYSYNLNHIRAIHHSDIHKDQPIFILPSGTDIKITRQLVSGHPDFSTKYAYQLKSEILDEVFKKIKERLKENASILSQKYESSMGIFEFDSNKIYVYGYHIDELFGQQMRERYIPLTNNPFVYFTLIPFLYFPILAIFLLLLFLRKKKKVK